MNVVTKLKRKLNELAELGEDGDEGKALPLCHHCDTRLLPTTKRVCYGDMLYCWRCWMRRPVDGGAL